MRLERLTKTKNWYYKPYVRYVLSDNELDTIICSVYKNEVNFSHFASFEKRYGGQDLNGKSVLIYRHNAWGDQLMASALPRYLKTLYPQAKVHLYCHPDVLSLWAGNPFMEGSAIPLPMNFDAVQQYDYHILFEGMLEGNSEFDQRCCYDDMFSFCGLENVPDAFKRPFILPSPEDYLFVKEAGLDLDRDYVVYHLSPANNNRCYPPAQGAEFVSRVLNEMKKDVILVGLDKDGELTKEFYKRITQVESGSGKLINMVNKTRTFRDLIPIIEHANALVCPDSSVLHLSACFPETPVVSLWGLFHPDTRAKYYVNDHPIFKKDSCPYAPCYDHNFHLPVGHCIKAENAPDKASEVEWCQVLKNIDPDEIYEKVKEVIR